MRLCGPLPFRLGKDTVMDTTMIVLSYVCETIETESRPPSVRAVASLLGCSPATAHDIISSLVDRGLLELSGTVRALSLTEEALILIGRI